MFSLGPVHEAPIRGLSSLSTVFRKRRADPPSQRLWRDKKQQVAPHNVPGVNESVEVIRKNLEREARLITDLLDRLEVPASETEPVPQSKPLRKRTAYIRKAEEPKRG